MQNIFFNLLRQLVSVHLAAFVYTSCVSTSEILGIIEERTISMKVFKEKSQKIYVTAVRKWLKPGCHVRISNITNSLHFIANL